LYGDAPVACGEPGDSPVLSDLRFYVTDLTSGAVHLVDLENGSGACENGTPDINATINLNAVEAGAKGIRFQVGVPFELNHADPLQADAPLNVSAMHWHWRSGYKFLSAGVRSADDGFWIHVGSTGCEGTVRNISGCSSPNRISVHLADFDAASSVVAVDLSALFAGTNLADGIAGDCSSGPAETSCGPPFAALGLDHSNSGVAGAQRVFRAVPR
jgi:uncharacterized repeat protein (TIGR04052 family)